MGWKLNGNFALLMGETGCQKRWVKCQKVPFSFDAVSKIALEETADSNRGQLKDKLTVRSSSNTAVDANNAFTNLQCVEFSSLFYRIIVIISIEELIKTFAGPESQLLKLWLDAQFFCWHRGHDYLKMWLTRATIAKVPKPLPARSHKEVAGSSISWIIRDKERAGHFYLRKLLCTYCIYCEMAKRHFKKQCYPCNFLSQRLFGLSGCNCERVNHYKENSQFMRNLISPLYSRFAAEGTRQSC